MPLARDLNAWLTEFVTPARGRVAWIERLTLLLALDVGVRGLALAVQGGLMLTTAFFGGGGDWKIHLRWFVIAAVPWAAAVMVLALLSRRYPPRVFGPVLFYDLVRTARRVRFTVVRTVYAGVLACILLYLGAVFLLFDEPGFDNNRMGIMAQIYFYVFMVVQFVVVLLLTPAYVAGAVAEEKERKTLEFILATDLRNREIILGKFVSRLFNLSFLLLAGLPIISFLQFLGGVDPGLVFAGFSATALTMFSLAGLSIVNSVICRRARDAIVLTYLGMLAYYLLASLLLIVKPLSNPFALPGLDTFPSGIVPGWTSPIELWDVIKAINSGNIFWVIFGELGMGSRGSTVVINDELPRVMRNYAIFNGGIGGFCLVWSILRLRVIALREASGSQRGSRKAEGETEAAPRRSSPPAKKRPRVGKHPMIWKEVFAEGGMRLTVFGRIIFLTLVAASFVPTALTFYFYFAEPLGARNMSWREATETISIVQIRIVGTVVMCLLILTVVVRAAGSVHSERERHTLDELLTTPLTTGQIIFGKWLGAVASVRWGWLWLGLIWAIGVFTGALAWWAVPLLIVSWFVYATIAGGIGVWFSTGTRSTLRATVAALMTVLFLYGGYWLVLGLCCFTPLVFMERGGGVLERDFGEIMWKVFYGQTPPLVMGLFGFNGEEFSDRRGYDWNTVIHMTISSLFGMGLWAAMIPVLWVLICKRFREQTGRIETVLAQRPTPRLKRSAAALTAKDGPLDAILIAEEQRDPVAEPTEDVPTALPADEPEAENDAGGIRQKPEGPESADAS